MEYTGSGPDGDFTHQTILDQRLDLALVSDRTSGKKSVIKQVGMQSRALKPHHFPCNFVNQKPGRFDMRIPESRPPPFNG